MFLLQNNDKDGVFNLFDVCFHFQNKHFSLVDFLPGNRALITVVSKLKILNLEAASIDVVFQGKLYNDPGVHILNNSTGGFTLDIRRIIVMMMMMMMMMMMEMAMAMTMTMMMMTV